MHASTSSEVAANKVMLAFSHTLCARCMPRLTGRRSSCNSSVLAHLMSEWFFRLSSSTVRWTFLCGDGCASVTDPGNLVAGVQIIPQGCACSRARSLEENVEVTQFFPLERIDAVPVPQIRNKLWESQSTFHKSGFSASQSGSWAASTTDHGENVEVIQLMRVAVAQIVAVPVPTDQ